MIILLLIAQLGLKSDNLILSDIGRYETIGSPNFQYLAMGENSGDELQGSGSPAVNKSSKRWMVSEPLGGLVGGGLLGLIGAGAGYLFVGGGDVIVQMYCGSVGAISGYSIGTGLGIWNTGKRIEKEKGSLLAALIGSTLGCLGGYLITFGDVGSALAGSLIFGLISYRITLK